MTKELYEAVDFIKKDMQFYSVRDFYANAPKIIQYFQEGNSYVRQLYMWYVFANPNISFKKKTEIWDFITTPK